MLELGGLPDGCTDRDVDRHAPGGEGYGGLAPEWEDRDEGDGTDMPPEARRSRHFRHMAERESGLTGEEAGPELEMNLQFQVGYLADKCAMMQLSYEHTERQLNNARETASNLADLVNLLRERLKGTQRGW